ncbi:MAG: ATP-binding cassette domain-containing protein [Bacillota bacterium]|nr:ATP-binding cassette domain-containing protein [Bacillota bacterium]
MGKMEEKKLKTTVTPSDSHMGNVKRNQVIWEITGQLQGARTLEEALRDSLTEVVRFLGSEAGTIWFYDRQGDQRLHPSFWFGGEDISGLSLAPGEGIAGTVVEMGVSVIVKDCQKDPRWAGRFDEKTGFVTRSMICVPLRNQYEVIGCIQIINKKDGSLYDGEDVSLCETLAELTAIAVESRGLDVDFSEKRPPILSLKQGNKVFGEGTAQIRALKEVNLDIREGELLVVLGKSGCGKSTLLNIIGGMDRLTSGMLSFEGADYSTVDERTLTEYRRASVGFVFQSYNLMPTLTAEENLEFVGGLSGDAIPAEEALKRVGMLPYKDQYPSQLSGGQQQRVSIACALAKRPKIILADEPTAALDFETSIQVLTALKEVVASGTTLVMVTHNEEIAKMADRVVRMQDGAIADIMINSHPAKPEELVW